MLLVLLRLMAAVAALHSRDGRSGRLPFAADDLPLHVGVQKLGVLEALKLARALPLAEAAAVEVGLRVAADAVVAQEHRDPGEYHDGCQHEGRAGDHHGPRVVGG